MIYHITTADKWQQALKDGFYEPPGFATEGFIHTSYDNQVEGVLKRYYQGKENLLKLHINTEKVTAEIKYELSSSINEIFPHIYGPLNIDAVVAVSEELT